MAQKEQQVSRFGMVLLRFFVGKPLIWKYGVKHKNMQPLLDLKPPYLVLSNHLNTFDPMIISCSVPRNIQWVASDVLFRNRFLRFLLKRVVGAISKSKAKSDFYTIRQITEVVRDKGIIGLFPEGQRSWDGRTLPIMYATAKLVRMLKIPVVFCILEGGYHTLPRWSPHRRKGEMTLSFQDPWMPEEFAKLKADEIFQEITRRLAYDAYEYQRSRQIIFASNRRAEYLEHVLFVCPSCRSISTIHSEGNHCRCTSCSLEAEVDPYGFFVFNRPQIDFETVAHWNDWQLEYLREQFASQTWGPDEVLFSNEDVTHATGYRDSAMNDQGTVRLSFTPKGFRMEDDRGTYLFDFNEINALSVSLQRNIEFYEGQTLHRFVTPKPRASAYKYLSAFECLEAVTDIADATAGAQSL